MFSIRPGNSSARDKEKQEQPMSDNEQREVVVVDIQMPFWSIVILMVKWAIAAIPALGPVHTKYT